jgi:hypothetical protein
VWKNVGGQRPTVQAIVKIVIHTRTAALRAVVTRGKEESNTVIHAKRKRTAQHHSVETRGRILLATVRTAWIRLRKVARITS